MEFKYPRVSDILSPYTNITLSCVPKHYLEDACKRGTIIHQYAIAYARGEFVPPIDSSYKPYLESFIQWCDNEIDEIILSEKRLHNEELEFCGQPDLVVKLKGKKEKVLIDLKSSTQIYRSYPLQLAAYMDLCGLNGIGCDKAIILKLNKDGEIAKVYDYGDCNPYYKIFLKALDMYNYFFRSSKNKTKKEI